MRPIVYQGHITTHVGRQQFDPISRVMRMKYNAFANCQTAATEVEDANTVSDAATYSHPLHMMIPCNHDDGFAIVCAGVYIPQSPFRLLQTVISVFLRDHLPFLDQLAHRGTKGCAEQFLLFLAHPKQVPADGNTTCNYIFKVLKPNRSSCLREMRVWIFGQTYLNALNLTIDSAHSSERLVG